ncbi:pentatricopeptide repeat-containing protein At2g01390 [Malania oleifera]|uniref:pentatricopeptide repeat-containing protein At2g01390 n=1 Tax=Malania oleifera TaxID=397392 RepID=UPI0025ADB193|nr:pentatricopeptide repeat-containing protein At2g01390 [Malania oleifera]XP_057975119.1 pentatricopeptide repeat-containing protein At2g01390 [Malania oleifera]
MFSSYGTFGFIRKFKWFLGICNDWSFGLQKLSIRGVHSLHRFKPKKQFHQFSRRTGKSGKPIEREDMGPKAYMRDTIGSIWKILRHSTWDSAQEQLERLSVKWDSYTVSQVLKTHPPMEKAWLFFIWASQLKGFKHDQFTYTTMLDIFGEAGRISSMKFVFQQMQEKGIKIDAVTYTSLLHWLSNSGDIDGSVKAWKEMKATGCRPTVVSYTAYMKVLLDNKRVKEATDVYKEMLQSGCSPNCYTYTVLMEYLARSGKYKAVLEIFSKMQEAGVQPDKATCNILVEKCCKAGEIWALTQILQYMKDNSLVLRYPIYLQAHETLKIAGVSDVLLRRVNPHCRCISEEGMVKSGATASDYNNYVDIELVKGLLTKQKFAVIDHLLTEMVNRKIKLETAIVSDIIMLNCAHCRPNGALLCFEYGVKMSINIEKTAYIALVGVFLRTNSFPKVVEIVEEMVRAGLSLGIYLGALLIYRLGCARRTGSAEAIFNLLPEEQKCTSTYTALIGAYFFVGCFDKGLQIFKAMQGKGIHPALGTYSVLLAGLEKCGRVCGTDTFRKERKSLRNSVHSQNVVPMDEKICNLLFAGDTVLM